MENSEDENEVGNDDFSDSTTELKNTEQSGLNIPPSNLGGTSQNGDMEDDSEPISIEEEMKKSYLDYAMSVIVSRAIPDLRDGLKPVHRRILYAMNETGNTFDKSYRKSARPVGDVMGKYHPHGDGAIYDALVRMAQDFSMSLPLLDGQGNFGSMDGDSAAAMRYTEVRLAESANFILSDIEKNTVEFQDNYDGKDREPSVLPSRFPNMLVNGAGGIAVGMATNIPPHNLSEIVDGTLRIIETPDVSIDELMEIIPGPDFPTGGVILGRSGARKAYQDGRGSVIIRSKSTIEEVKKDKFAIIITEIPYQVNKANLIEKIAEQARDKKIEGISHIQDESDRFGVRIVIELKRDATAEVVLNQLYRQTQVQNSFGCNMLALNLGKPEQLNLKQFLTAFIEFRESVVTKRTIFELNKARDRSHILCGLAVAVKHVDEIVKIIRSSRDPAEARSLLMGKVWNVSELIDYFKLIDDPSHPVRDDGTYNLSEKQTKAILELRLQRLTAIGVKEVTSELEELANKIKDYLDILSSKSRINAIISEELMEVKEKFGIPRRSEIVDFEGDLEDEDLIEKEDMVVSVTSAGYIKRTALTEYREQKRGGKGLQGMNTKDEDFVTNLFVANTHTQLLFFTSDGIAYKLKTWRLPLAGRNARGKAIINILPIPKETTITTIMPIEVEEENWDKLHIFFSTSNGSVRRNALSDFSNVRANGKIAIKLQEGTSLVDVKICSNNDDIMIATSRGKAIRFNVSDVRVFKGRDSSGVRGIKLAKDDKVVSMSVLENVIASSDERSSFSKMSRSENHVEADKSGQMEDKEDAVDITLSSERFKELQDSEQWILMITSGGFGKRSSAYEYREASRGGQGVTAANIGRREDRVIASFPVENDDQIMLITSTGQAIRCPVSDISKQSRTASGVKVFNTADGEEVVSVAYIAEKTEET